MHIAAGPAYLGNWDRLSHRLSEKWGAVGVTEIPIASPFYHKEKAGCSLSRVLISGVCTVSVLAALWVRIHNTFMLYMCF